MNTYKHKNCFKKDNRISYIFLNSHKNWSSNYSDAIKSAGSSFSEDYSLEIFQTIITFFDY